MSSKMPLRIDPEVQNLFIEAFDKIEVHMNKYKSMLSDYRTPDRRSRPHYGYGSIISYMNHLTVFF